MNEEKSQVAECERLYSLWDCGPLYIVVNYVSCAEDVGMELVIMFPASSVFEVADMAPLTQK